ncbi:E3 ubiquitin-protein ligase RBBP6 isoform X2 [Drosophila bipectinata]|uniref:E3 ubiquitin-protein ligase RBBP6 isoform X2 n=1 Tax=Drosophila bipectinata TaxID=42026 RepID=UPI0038B3EBF7
MLKNNPQYHLNMSVHYKFKSTLNFDTITFDGLHISVGDLKREIVQQKRLGKVIDFDLQITNAQSKEEYKEDGTLIPKNTTLIISRIPIAHPPKKGWEPPSAENAFTAAPTNKAQDNFNMDLSKMQGSEEDKIQAMMMQSTVDYDPKTYHRIKGQSQVGEVPASYRCNKCKKSGHWIKNCPYILGKDQQEVKRNTGIPRSFRDKPEADQEAQFVLPAEQNQEIPEDLICGICRDLFVDAVMIPCCGSSFCDDCVRTSLLESEDSECPDCKEKNCSPGSLIPNRFLRNSVNAFKNETGYKISNVKSAVKHEEKPPVEKEKEKEEEPPVEEPQPEEPEKPEKAEKPEETETNGKKEQPKSESPEPTPAPEEPPKEKEKDKYDSDYEDNITIKMPQSATDSAPISRKASPSYSQKPSESSHRRETKSDYAEHDQHRPSKSEAGKSERSLLPTPIGTLPNYQGHMMGEEERRAEEARRSSAYKQSYMPMQRGPPPMHMMGHHIPSYNNGYNSMGQRPPLR